MDASIEGRLPIEPPLVKVTTEEETKSDDQLRKEEVKSSGQSAHILKLLTFLSNYPAVKVALLHLCQSGTWVVFNKYLEVGCGACFSVKSDEKQLDVMCFSVKSDEK